MAKNTFEGIPVGIRLRRKLANKIIYYIRYGKQEQRAYAVPYNPRTAKQQIKRTVFRAGVWEWHKMTPAEKEPWIKEAKKHRTWSPFITFMSAWLKYLWKEVPMRVPDYDSGWITMPAGHVTTLTHDLGGDPNDYMVVLTAKSVTRGINNMFIGGDRYDVDRRGFDYREISNATIDIRRLSTDTHAPEVRVRIWRYA